MSLFQLSIGLLILFFMVLRPFLYKPCIKYFPSELSAAFTSIWLLTGLLVSCPVFGHLLLANIQSIIKSPYLIISLLKGILLWFMIKLQQLINKESTSSSVFFGFIAMALGSLINNLFFKEGLLVSQLICICALGCLGIIFIVQGDAKRLSLKDKTNFVIIICIGALFSVFDHLAIPQIGWYPHLLFSTISMFVVCVFYGLSKQDYYNIFRNRSIIIAGIVYTVSEFLIIYSSTNLLPVSFVAVFMRMAAPIVMLISSIKYHEQSFKNQLLFSGLAMVFVLPLIFIQK